MRRRPTLEELTRLQREALEQFLADHPDAIKCEVCGDYPGYDCRCDDDAYLSTAPFLLHDK